jgi:hypothetical protein
MAQVPNDKSPAVSQAEEALRSLGVSKAMFNQRPVGRGHWFADWAGPIAQSEVYIAVTGKGPAPRKVRLLLDDWIFEDMAPDHIGTVLSRIFSAEATIRSGRSLLVFPVQVLRVTSGRARYTAARKPAPPGELSAWEQALTADR